MDRGVSTIVQACTMSDYAAYCRVRMAASTGDERAEWRTLFQSLVLLEGAGDCERLVSLAGSDYWFADEPNDDVRQARCEARWKVYTEFLSVLGQGEERAA